MKCKAPILSKALFLSSMSLLGSCNHSSKVFEMHDREKLKLSQQDPKYIQDYIMKSFRKGIEEIAPLSSNTSKSAVMLIGATGTGKSTSMMILHGAPLEATYPSNDSKKSKKNIVVDLKKNVINPNADLSKFSSRRDRRKKEAQTLTNGPKIGHSYVDSETIYPSCLEGMGLTSNNTSKICYWDTPGGNDTQGIKNNDKYQQVINSYFIERIFATHNETKIFLTVRESHIDDKNVGLFPLLYNTCKTFSKIESYEQSIGLLVTNVSQIPNCSDEELLEEAYYMVEKYRDDVVVSNNTSEKEKQNVLKLLNEILKQQDSDGNELKYGKIMIVKKPNDLIPDTTEFYKSFTERATVIVNALSSMNNPQIITSVDISKRGLIENLFKQSSDYITTTIQEYKAEVENILKSLKNKLNKASDNSTSYIAEVCDCKALLDNIILIQLENEPLKFLKIASEGHDALKTKVQGIEDSLIILNFLASIQIGDNGDKIKCLPEEVILSGVKDLKDFIDAEDGPLDIVDDLTKHIQENIKKLAENQFKEFIEVDLKGDKVFQIWLEMVNFMPKYINGILKKSSKMNASQFLDKLVGENGAFSLEELRDTLKTMENSKSNSEYIPNNEWVKNNLFPILRSSIDKELDSAKKISETSNTISSIEELTRSIIKKAEELKQ